MSGGGHGGLTEPLCFPPVDAQETSVVYGDFCLVCSFVLLFDRFSSYPIFFPSILEFWQANVHTGDEKRRLELMPAKLTISLIALIYDSLGKLIYKV